MMIGLGDKVVDGEVGKNNYRNDEGKGREGVMEEQGVRVDSGNVLKGERRRLRRNG